MSSIARRTALALVVATWVTTANAADWVAEPIDPWWYYGGQKSALALDPLGRPAVAYGQDMLRYAVRERTLWREEIVRDRRCTLGGVSLAFDGAGDPVLAYGAFQEGLTQTLEVARRRAGVWTIEIVGTAAWRGTTLEADIALAIDRNGHPGVAYVHESKAEVELARWDGTTWAYESIAAPGISPGSGLSLAFDSAGNPAIASSRGWEGVHVLRWDGSAWTDEAPPLPRPATTIADCLIAFDSTGEPAILYLASGPGVGLIFARRRGGAWESETVLASWAHALRNSPFALAFDGADNPIIGYSETYAISQVDRKVGSTWEHLGGQAKMHDIAIDAAGNILNLYQADGQSIGVRTWDGSRWSANLIAVAVPKLPQFAFALEPTTGKAVAAFGGEWAGRWDGSSWTHDLVSAWGGTYSTTSVPAAAAFDPTTREPILAVINNNEVHCQRRTGAMWTDELVHTDRFSSIQGGISVAVDILGRPWIAFTDTAGLWTAHWDGLIWLATLVDDGVRGEATSIAVGSTGEPVIAYKAGRELRVARRGDTGWTVETLLTNTTQSIPSLALDPLDRPRLSHVRDLAVPSLELASWTGSEWVFEVVRDTDVSRENPSLSIGPSGEVAIAFASTLGLNVARQSGPTWTIESLGFGGDLPTLRHDAAGALAVAFLGCGDVPRWARESTDLRAHRWSIPIIAPSWRENYFPHTPLTDDETAPFPLAAALPASGRDDIPSTDPLTMYRVLNAGEPTGNRLKVVKSETGVAISY